MPDVFFYHWASRGPQLWIGLSPSKNKRNKKADGSPRRCYVSHSLFNRADFCGEGTGISGCLTNRFGSRFGTSTKLFRGVIGPISTPNDSLNAVFDDIISLCGSCRNNALPRSPREKLQLVAILSLRVIGLSLQ